jgi:uncharacterized protein (TIGR02996 family)
MASDLHLAAQLPGEADWLAAVVAAPADDTVKLVYADWLEEQGDRRGAFLRRFVDAVRANAYFPEYEAAPLGWLVLVGVPLAVLIRSRGLTEHRAAILARAKPAVAIFTEPVKESLRPRPLGGSKFGGLPGLPLGASWPRSDNGMPLEFLAQLDLAELQQTVADRALPESGSLSFFMYHNCYQDEYGDSGGRGTSGGLRMIHTPAGTDLHPLGPPDDLTEELGRPRSPCRLTFVDALDVPNEWPSFDVSLRPPFLDGADHQLLGYSHKTVLTEDPTPGPDWEQLIRFNSDRKLHWNWGDGHRLFWYIKSADLRSRRFDHTVAIDG